MLDVSKGWPLLFIIVEQARNYCCQVAGAAQGLSVQCSSSPTLNPVPRRESSPVSHSYITWQLNNITASLLTQAEYFTLLTPSDSSVSCSKKSCLASSADARAPCMGRCSSVKNISLPWTHPASTHSVSPAKGLLPLSSHPSWSTMPLWLDSLALACSQSPFSWQCNSAHS